MVLRANLPGRFTFKYVCGSEEYPEYVGSEFIDGFGIYVNGTNVAKPNGLPVNVNHPGMTAISETEIDGVLVPTGSASPLISTSVNFSTGDIKVTFIIGDASDEVLDSTAYVGKTKVLFLDTTDGGPVPAPGAAGTALLAIALGARRRR